jgi:hypothetical protein
MTKEHLHKKLDEAERTVGELRTLALNTGQNVECSWLEREIALGRTLVDNAYNAQISPEREEALSKLISHTVDDAQWLRKFYVISYN